MSLNLKKKQHHQVVEKAYYMAYSLQKFDHFCKKNKQWFYIFLTGGLVGLASYTGFQYWQSQQVKDLQKSLIQPVYYFEEGQYDKALQGDENMTGFVKLFKQYTAKPATNLLNLYTGLAYVHNKAYEQALPYLKNCQLDDFIIKARVLAVIGDVYVMQKQYDQAIPYYEKAAMYQPNPAFSPSYWDKAAMAYEQQQQYEKAAQCYQKIMDDFPKSSTYDLAVKHHARLQQLAL